MTLVHLYAFTLITSEIERKTCLNVVIDVACGVMPLILGALQTFIL